jgi:hypothetical protein
MDFPIKLSLQIFCGFFTTRQSLKLDWSLGNDFVTGILFNHKVSLGRANSPKDEIWKKYTVTRLKPFRDCTSVEAFFPDDLMETIKANSAYAESPMMYRPYIICEACLNLQLSLLKKFLKQNIPDQMTEVVNSLIALIELVPSTTLPFCPAISSPKFSRNAIEFSDITASAETKENNC